MGVHQIERHLRMAALSFLLYAVVAGLLVPPASFFPASWLNRRLLSMYFGVPSPVIRAIGGILIAYFMIRSLEVFRVELRRRLDEASRAWALAQERERISRDLHDGILQHLYGAGLCLENSLPTVPQDPTTTTTLIRKSIDLLNRGMQDIRSYIFDLNWGVETDLEKKLKNLLEANPNGEEPKIQFETLGSGTLKLPGSIGLHLYHFIQEAVTNTRKHARAKSLQVRLVYSKDALKVTIEDDGAGFVPEEGWQKSNERQQGLRNMKRRAELLGGEFEIETQPNRGTRVSLTLPLRTIDHRP
jgi:signal transduction histidine kinase